MSKNFEKVIREQFTSQELPYDPKHWEGIERKLDQRKRTKWSLGVGSAAVLVAGSLYFSGVLDKAEIELPVEQTQVENNEVKADPIIQEEKVETTTPTPAPVEETVAEETPTPVQEEPETLVEETKEPVIEKDVPVLDKKEENTQAVQLAISISKTNICAGEFVEFTAPEFPEPVDLEWSFGNGKKASTPIAKHQFGRAGNFNITLRASSIISDKQWTVHGEEKVNVKATPSSNISIFETKENGVPSHEFELDNEVAKVEWFINDHKIDAKNPKAYLHHKGGYTVKAKLTTLEGCQQTVEETVMVQNEFNFLAPNAFTPNGDGTNDTFLPKGLENANHPFVLEIFNAQSGDKVFESENGGEAWDGRHYKTGGLVETGTYGWALKVKLPNGEFENYSGKLQLLP